MRFSHVLLFAILFLPKQSEAASTTEKRNGMMYAFGIGNSTCAYWLSSPAHESEGKTWLLGYWTGRNVANNQNPHAGETLGSEGVWKATKQLCAEDRSKDLIDVAERAYYWIAHERR